jgi:hypothetical protein
MAEGTAPPMGKLRVGPWWLAGMRLKEMPRAGCSGLHKGRKQVLPVTPGIPGIGKNSYHKPESLAATVSHAHIVSKMDHNPPK